MVVGEGALPPAMGGTADHVFLKHPTNATVLIFQSEYDSVLALSGSVPPRALLGHCDVTCCDALES